MWERRKCHGGGGELGGVASPRFVTWGVLVFAYLSAATVVGQGVPVGAPAAAQPARQLTPDEQANVRVYEGANRSVVNVNTKGTVAAGLFFEVPSEGAGSASVLDKQGHLLTNYHVVQGGRPFLNDGSWKEPTRSRSCCMTVPPMTRSWLALMLRPTWPS